MKWGQIILKDFNEIDKYVNILYSLKKSHPLWFSDYLKNLGHDVYNFGQSGVSSLDILYQFKFKSQHLFLIIQ